jgi:hypothetical protein
MYQFTDLVRGGETARDVKQKFPETEPVFERFGLNRLRKKSGFLGLRFSGRCSEGP